jgi:hypothetical protein
MSFSPITKTFAMFRRTRGYVVLTLLIVTGLASQVYSPTISSSERHVVMTQLKDCRRNFVSATSGLSPAQLNYTPAGGRSIRQLCTQIEDYNNEIWSNAEASLQTPKDEHCLAGKSCCRFIPSEKQQSTCKKTCSQSSAHHASWPKGGNITDCIKMSQAGLIKYARTTTEDLHGHILDTKNGRMDIYQALLAISSNTNDLVAAINKVKANPRFPQK